MINGNGAYASGKQTTDYGIKYYQSAVDEFAKQFAGLMNKLNGGDESDDRLMFTSADGSPINAGNIRISDAWLKDATMIAKIYNEKTGAYDYPVNLDGNAVNKLLLGMDDSVQIGKGDYEGSSLRLYTLPQQPPCAEYRICRKAVRYVYRNGNLTA